MVVRDKLAIHTSLKSPRPVRKDPPRYLSCVVGAALSLHLAACNYGNIGHDLRCPNWGLRVSGRRVVDSDKPFTPGRRYLGTIFFFLLFPSRPFFVRVDPPFTYILLSPFLPSVKACFERVPAFVRGGERACLENPNGGSTFPLTNECRDESPSGGGGGLGGVMQT